MSRFSAAAAASRVKYGHSLNALVGVSAATFFVIIVTLVDTYDDPVRYNIKLIAVALAFIVMGLTYHYALHAPVSHEPLLSQQTKDELRWLLSRTVVRARHIRNRAVIDMCAALTSLADVVEWAVSGIVTWCVVSAKRLLDRFFPRTRARPLLISARRYR